MKNQRDSKIELTRIAACLTVIACHLFYCISQPHLGTGLNNFFRCLVSDGVAVFWVITGLFFFKKDYLPTLKHALKNIALPLVIYSVVFFYIGRMLIYDCSLRDSFSHTTHDYLVLATSAITFTNSVEGIGQVWYLYIYLFIIIFLYAILKPFVSYLNSSKTAQRSFFLISLLLIVLNDLSLNNLLEAEHRGIRGAFIASIFIIWGHLIYQNKNIFFKKKYKYAYAIAYLLINIIRSVILSISQNVLNNDNVIHWYTSFGLLSSVCVLGFFMSHEAPSETHSKLIRLTASNTFNIYILHGFVMTRLNNHGYFSLIQNPVTACTKNTIASDLLSFLLILLLVFIVSLLISLCIELSKKLLKTITTRLFQKP